MKATFLEADVPLTKTFFKQDGKIEKIGHPRIYNYISHEVTYDSIESLYDHIREHADKGHCFLKGLVSRPLRNEPRAGTTDPNATTKVLLLDLDGVKNSSAPDDFLTHLKLGDTDYIVQYSSSMGILPERGMSAHIFMLLDKETAPAILKQYLMQWNLSTPLLNGNLGLTRTNNALRWPLDVTTCQNDKLIYIAPPLLKDGVQDNFEGERIQLVKKKKRLLVLPEPFPNAETNAQRTQDELNRLRVAKGLEKRPKTTMRSVGGVEYMTKPDRAVVTGVREKAPFTYLNINGGDSWAYYHPTNNPEFIHNFKSEPIYKTSELLPDYWSEVKGKMNEVRVAEDGNIYLAFRDFRTAQYYNGVYDQKRDALNIAVAKSTQQLDDFLQQHDQSVPEFYPDWNVRFDPHLGQIVDLKNKVVNKYQPSAYMRMTPPLVKTVPPMVTKVIMHVLGNDEEVFEHFMNWSAVIFQYKCRTGTGWVTHGIQGTGKGLMLDRIYRPLMGADYVVTKRMRELDSQFNGYMERAFIMWVDEAQQESFKPDGLVNADIKNFITEPRISIRNMHTIAYEADNYMNWIFASNKGHIIQIDPDDRRFNVAVYQALRLEITDEELKQLEEELFLFYGYLMHRRADKDIARRALNNQAKSRMALINRPAIDVASDAINAGDLEHFWSQMPQGDALDAMVSWERERAERYIKLVKHIADDEPTCILREELFVLLDYTIGGIPKEPAKLGAYLKHHKLDIRPVTRKGKPYRGVTVKWKVKPEMKTTTS